MTDEETIERKIHIKEQLIEMLREEIEFMKELLITIKFNKKAGVNNAEED